jgi:Asp/Glu/hydantoin racemase
VTARSLGVLMLDTRFPRLVGDIGNPATFDFPVRYRVVEGASPRRVVLNGDRGLLAPFVEAARRLAADGVDAIATSCGFLALFQDEMQAAVELPLWTSSLLDVAPIAARLPPGRRVGIVTVDADSLGPRHLAAAGAPLDTPTEGLARDASFRRALLDNLASFDVAAARDATVAAARRLLERHPEVAAIVLECTNMPPYAEAVREATGLPVHDITTLVATRFAAEVEASP